MDPITKTVTKEPMKPFMVNQLTVSFDRERIVLSPFDDILHKQLIDYNVERISQSGIPVYTSKNEHYVDALGLAHLAFVLEFPNLTAMIKKPTFTNKIEHSSVTLGQNRIINAFKDISSSFSNPWKNQSNRNNDDDRYGDKPYWTKVPMTRSGSNSSIRSTNWGSRTGRGFKGRSTW